MQYKQFFHIFLWICHIYFSDKNYLFLYFLEMYHCCTFAGNWGCDRSAVNGHILNPIMSGKVTTNAAIRYGKVTVRAMIPKGDWIWPGTFYI
jgi:hypothetical protein